MNTEALNKNREKSLGYLMGRAQRAMDNRFQKDFEVAGLDLTKEQWILLVNLWIKDGQNQKELARNVYKDKASITRTLSMMEAKSLLVRIEDNQDRRNKLIHLTQKGKDLREITIPIVKMLHQKALEGLSDKEIKICRKVLRKISENLAMPAKKIVEDAT